MSTVTLIYEDNDILVLNKPRFLATAPIKNSLKPTLVEWALNYYPAITQVNGFKKDEFSLIHRLDNDTEGLVLFAKNQKSYNFLWQQQQDNLIKKQYLAYCTVEQASLAPPNFSIKKWQNFIIQKVFKIDFILEQRFVKAAAKSAKVRAVSALSASKNASKIYSTVFTLTKENNAIKAECQLTKGFRHQVRAGLHALGLPIINDPFYGELSYANEEPFQFWATSLGFYQPKNHQWLEIKKQVC